MADVLKIRRPQNDTLTVRLLGDGRINLSTTGPSIGAGSNVTEAEFERIAAFVGGHDGAQPFLAKLRARMAR